MDGGVAYPPTLAVTDSSVVAVAVAIVTCTPHTPHPPVGIGDERPPKPLNTEYFSSYYSTLEFDRSMAAPLITPPIWFGFHPHATKEKICARTAAAASKGYLFVALK